MKTFFFFWRSPNFFGDRLNNFCDDVFFFFGDRLKNFCDFGEHLRLCPWSLALASSILVLGLESVCPRKGCPWPWPRFFFCVLGLGLGPEPCVVDSTSGYRSRVVLADGLQTDYFKVLS